MMNTLNAIGKSVWYWLAILGLGAFMEAAALYFQYGLGYGPCVLCIHIRIYVMAIMLVALFGLFTRANRTLRLTAHGLTFLLAIGFTERSWLTLGVERGFIDGACDMNSGLPTWFALDKWFPTVFEPWEPCGYTPEVLFGITMAESLIALSVVALAASLAMLIATLKSR